MVAPTPRSRSRKAMEKKERRMERKMGKPQRRSPVTVESLQVQLQVICLDLLCVFTCNSYVLLNTEHIGRSFLLTVTVGATLSDKYTAFPVNTSQ